DPDVLREIVDLRGLRRVPARDPVDERAVHPGQLDDLPVERFLFAGHASSGSRYRAVYHHTNTPAANETTDGTTGRQRAAPLNRTLKCCAVANSFVSSTITGAT